MHCPECGRRVDIIEPSFCPHCGASFGTCAAYAPPERGGRGRKAGVTAAAVILVAAVAVLVAVAAFSLSSDDSGQQAAYTKSDGIPVTEEIEVSGQAFLDGSLTAETGDNNTLVITLTGTQQTGSYTWYLYGDTGYAISSVSKSYPTLIIYLDNLKAGTYTVSVTYRGPWGIENVTGVVHIDGDVTESYTWTYEGVEYSVSVTYGYDDYLRYAYDSGASRYSTGTSGYSGMTGLVVADETVTALESALREAYLGAYGDGAAVDGQDYADFILAFVQLCFSYLDDSALYGTEEYWAYPLETLYHGGGDCEDTAVLCAALYLAAGYETGVFVIPGHAVVAVALAEYEVPRIGPSIWASYGVFSYTVDGITYYGGETTLEGWYMQTGLIDRSYSIGSDGTVWYMNQPYTGIYGLYTV